MIQITIDQLFHLHSLVILRYGGESGVRDLGRLEAALATQSQEVFDMDMYATVYEKSAAMMRGIIVDRPFLEGNKRTGILTGLTFLEVNGVKFSAREGEVEEFAVSVAGGDPDVSEIAAWLSAHSQNDTIG